MGRLLHHMSCKMGWDVAATAKAMAKVHHVDSVFSGTSSCYHCVYVCLCVGRGVCVCVCVCV